MPELGRNQTAACDSNRPWPFVELEARLSAGFATWSWGASGPRRGSALRQGDTSSSDDDNPRSKSTQ